MTEAEKLMIFNGYRKQDGYGKRKSEALADLIEFIEKHDADENLVDYKNTFRSLFTFLPSNEKKMVFNNLLCRFLSVMQKKNPKKKWNHTFYYNISLKN